MNKKVIAVLVALTLVFVLVAVAGCAKSGGTSSSSGGTFTIGVPLPQTGQEADAYPDMMNAMKMAVDQINANGGFLGKQVKLDGQDDACDPQTAVNAANKLVSDNADAIVGGYCSGAVLPTETIYNNAGLPDIVPAANASSLTSQGFNNVFLINCGGVTQAKTGADFMVKTMGAKKIVLVDDQSAFAVNLADLCAKDVADDGGTIIDRESVASTQVDFSSMLSKLKTLNPDFIYFTGYYNQAGLLIKQAKQIGLKTPQMGGDGTWNPKLWDIAGPANAEGYYITCTPASTDLPGAKDWVAQYTKTFNVPPGPYSAYAYDAIEVLNHVVKAVNSTDKAKIIAGLHATNDYQGLTGLIAFDQTGTRLHGTEVIEVIHNSAFVINDKQPAAQ